MSEPDERDRDMAADLYIRISRRYRTDSKWIAGAAQAIAAARAEERERCAQAMLSMIGALAAKIREAK